MPTASKTWAFATTSESWTGTASGSGNTVPYQSSLGNPAGCLGNVTAGRSKSGSGHWDVSGTWESLFGIPAGSTVTNILVSGDGYQGKCNTYNTGAASTDGPLELRDGSGVLLLTLVAGRAYSAVDSAWVTRSPGTLNQAVPSAQQPSNSSISFRLGGAVNTGASSSANNTLLQDNVKVTITYTLPGITAALAVTENADSCSASLSDAVGAQLAVTETPDTAAAAVSDPVGATLAAADSPDVFAASASDPVAATLSATEAPDAMAASLSLSSGITASLAVTEAKDTLAVAVGNPVAGQLSAQEARDTLAVTAANPVGGSLAAGDAADTLLAAVSPLVGGSLAASEGADILRFVVNSGGRTDPREWTGYQVHGHFHGCGPRPWGAGGISGGTHVQIQPPSFWPYHRPTVGQRLRTWVRSKLQGEKTVVG